MNSDRLFYEREVAYRLAHAELIAAMMLGRAGRCASASVPYGGSQVLLLAWSRMMVREGRGYIGHPKLMAGDAPGTLPEREKLIVA